MDRDSLIIKVREYKEQIDMWQSQCNVNYLMWSLMVEGELNELTGNYHDAIQAYEAAIDHTVLHDFVLEQALAIELQAEFYIRRGAKRAARSTMLDAIGTYSRIGASGKANQLRAKHEWVIKGTTTMRTVDAGVQTASSIGDIENTQFHIEENERQETRNLGRQTAGDRTQAWVGPGTGNGSTGKYGDSLAGHDAYGLGLDVLDLQSIVEFNQAISSELQIDRLLAQMTGIILESAGAQADFAGVVIEGEAGWCIAASGTSDNISSEVRMSALLIICCCAKTFRLFLSRRSKTKLKSKCFCIQCDLKRLFLFTTYSTTIDFVICSPSGLSYLFPYFKGKIYWESFIW